MGRLFLAEVFEKYRGNKLKNYELCPRHYLSPPSLIGMQCLK